MGHFNQAVAQELWESGQIDACIVYAMPCIQVKMAAAHRKLPDQTQWDDLESDYQMYLVMAIQRYQPTKGCKLFSWINNYLKYAELNFIRRESKYYLKNVQL